MRRYRIAVVVSTFPPYRGGMGNVAATQARVLSAAGHDVTVYTPTANLATTLSYRVQTLPVLVRYGNAALVPGVKSAVAAADVVIFHYPFFGGVEAFAWGKQNRQPPLLLYYHMDPIGRGLWCWVFAMHRRLVLRRLLDRAARVLVSSLDYAATSALQPFRARLGARLTEVPLAVDTARFKPGPKPEALLRRYSLGESTPVCLFVGSLDRAHYFKGVPVLLRAWQRCATDGARLLVIGEGEKRQAYQTMTARLGLAENVTFTGSVPDEELPAHYRLADVVVLPSTDRSEAFGLVLLEAMASGRPVVASRLPGVASVVREGTTGLLVVPGSAEALATALRRVLDDPSLRQAWGSCGRAVAEAEYSETVLTARLNSCLSTVL